MSKREAAPPRMIQNVFVLLLLALFAALSTLLVTLGAQVYRDTVETFDSHSTTRVLNSVVRSSVWTEDGNGEICVENFDELGINTLTVINDYDGERYFKRLYCKDGWLFESFTSEERQFDGETGESMCEATKFEPSINGNMVKIDVADAEGNEDTICIALRTGGADR